MVILRLLFIKLFGIFVPLLIATVSAMRSASLVGLKRNDRESSLASSRGLRFIIFSDVSMVRVLRFGELSRIALRSSASYIRKYRLENVGNHLRQFSKNFRSS